ncbi:hypothetical protein E2320_020660, partial [Naja naja]
MDYKDTFDMLDSLLSAQGMNIIDKEETSVALHIKRWALFGSHFLSAIHCLGIMCWWEVDEQPWQDDPSHA